MQTSARLCAACGGALPEVERGAYQVKCEFCGVVNDLAHAAGGAAPVIVQIDASAIPGAAAPTRAIAWIIGTAVFVTLAMGGFVAWRAQQQVRTVMVDASRTGTMLNEAATAMRTLADAQRTAAVRPADLAQAGNGWKTLDVPPPPGGWASVDPVATLDWATTIARAWQDDARLTRIDLSRMPAAGVIRLDGPSDDDHVGYRFVSSSRTQEWTARASAGEREPAVGWELMMTVAKSQVRALVTHGRPGRAEGTPSNADSLPLPTLLARAAKGRGFESAAFYDGYMIVLPREGWAWYLTGLGQSSSQPRVRARDGAVFPYR